MLGFQALFFCSWLLGATALDLTGAVVWNDVCPDAVALGRGKVVLNNGHLSGSITTDGSFTIYDVPTGSHLLSVIAHDHSFDKLRVDVVNETTHVHPYTLGTPFNPPSTVSLSYPIKLTPKEKLDFFMPPHSFNLYSLLTNPMVLFGLGGVALFAINSLVDVNALQEAAKQGSESESNAPRRLADSHDQSRGGPLKRGTKRTRR